MEIKIPWAKPTVGHEEMKEVIQTFEDDWLTMGPRVLKFEKIMADYLQVPHAIAVFNGTVALDITLKTIGIKNDDEVIVPAMTYFATASAVSYQNAIPVFVDIEKNSFNLDPERIEEAITEKTKAILFIDYGGNPSNFDEIDKIGKKHGIRIIQDGAQSLGAVYKSSPMGAQTEISTMSFHMAKIMTCIEGGMVFTHNNDFKEKLLSMRNQGEPQNGKYKHVLLGTNARMTDVQAAIGLAQFKKLPMMLEERRRVASMYNKIILESAISAEFFSSLDKDCKNAYFFYPILVNNRDKIVNQLREKHGIDTRIAYPMPLFKQEVYASGKVKCKYMECPVAEKVTSKIINLPIFPGMSDVMIETVVRALNIEIARSE